MISSVVPKASSRSTSARGGSITPDLIEVWQDGFNANPSYRAAMNACTRGNIEEIVLNRRVLSGLNWNFSHEVTGGAITNQKHAGHCWLFAGLNLLRTDLVSKLKVEDFEFSENYLVFWDRLEKANRFFEMMIALRDRPTDDRMVDYFLREPCTDGGEWHMVTSLIRKYGLVPKSAMAETFNITDSTFMNRVLAYKLREGAFAIRSAAKASDAKQVKQRAMAEMYRILCILLGEPPQRFDFTYRDKKKKFHEHRNMTPHEFYKQIVAVDLDDYKVLLSCPLESTPFFKTFSIDQLQNVVECPLGASLNVPLDVLKDVAVRVLKDKQALLFGCDALQMVNRKVGVFDPHLLEYDILLDTTFPLDRATRMQYLQARQNHNMVFVGVDLVDDRPVKWKVENSWGEDSGNKGFYMMTDGWFDEFVYALYVHKKYLSAEQLAMFKQEPTVLPPWHPLS